MEFSWRSRNRVFVHIFISVFQGDVDGFFEESVGEIGAVLGIDGFLGRRGIW